MRRSLRRTFFRPEVRRTRGTNQEQANMAEKWVDGKGFVFFTEVFVRIQVYPLKEKRTVKKGA